MFILRWMNINHIFSTYLNIKLHNDLIFTLSLVLNFKNVSNLNYLLSSQKSYYTLFDNANNSSKILLQNREIH